MKMKEMKRFCVNQRKWLVLALAAVLFNSCGTIFVAPTYPDDGRAVVEAKIDAYSSGENLSAKKVALLVCNDETVPKSDLKNLEFEGYIKRILEAKGYTFTSEHDKAEVVVFYEYGISDPREYTSQRTVPVWGQTGIAYSTTTQKTNIYGKTVYETRHTPSRGIVGSNVVTNTEIKYLRWANINAFDADFYRQTGEDKMLWVIEVTSEGSSDDLRYIFPYMMAASGGYVGQSSGIKRTEGIKDRDPRLLALKYPDRFVTVVINEGTKGKGSKNINMTVYKDMYRGGKLFIKAGTRVSVDVRRFANELWIRGGMATTSVDGDRVSFKPTPIVFFNRYGHKQAEAAAGTLLHLLITE
jgi:hypothetical protein